MARRPSHDAAFGHSGIHPRSFWTSANMRTLRMANPIPNRRQFPRAYISEVYGAASQSKSSRLRPGIWTAIVPPQAPSWPPNHHHSPPVCRPWLLRTPKLHQNIQAEVPGFMCSPDKGICTCMPRTGRNVPDREPLPTTRVGGISAQVPASLRLPNSRSHQHHSPSALGDVQVRDTPNRKCRCGFEP